MVLFNIAILTSGTQFAENPDPSSALLFSFYALSVFLLVQFLGARLFTNLKERYGSFILIFFIVLSTLAAGFLLASFFLHSFTHRLFAGVVGGVLIWTALGEIAEYLGWYKPHARNAVWIYLLTVAVWLTLFFMVPDVPTPILGFLGYPILTWGTYLTRIRIVSRWGADSLASTMLMLVLAAVSGGAVVAGALIGSKLSGVLAGLVFAITGWTIMEIIWERGMADGPWKQAHSPKN